MVRVFVEGIDDEKFIIKLLNDLKSSSDIEVPKAFNFGSIINRLGGKKKLLDFNHEKYKQVSELIEIDEIRKALFIFDCDFEKDDKTCNGMKKSLECFENLKKECYEHFDDLIKCLDVEKLKPNKKPIANLYRDLYPYPQFDLKDDRFNELKEKLKNLFKGTEQ